MKSLKNLVPLITIAVVSTLLYTACTSKVTNTEKNIVSVRGDYPMYDTISAARAV